MTIRGFLIDTETNHTKRIVRFDVEYIESKNDYGNRYYMSLTMRDEITGKETFNELYDVRYDKFFDKSKEYALKVICNNWSGLNGSWKFVEA